MLWEGTRDSANGRQQGARRGPSFVAGVQWHPEFHDPADTVTFDDGPMLQDFFAAARAAQR